MPTNELVLEVLDSNKLAVISTFGDDYPESAVLEFGHTKDFELIFDTLPTSRKYKNLKKNNKVSFVIGWKDNTTVQYEGNAEELNDENAKNYKKIYLLKNPEAKKWADKVIFFRVIPHWIRYTNLNKYPWDIQELVF